jgi:hypothetical protein
MIQEKKLIEEKSAASLPIIIREVADVVLLVNDGRYVKSSQGANHDNSISDQSYKRHAVNDVCPVDYPILPIQVNAWGPNSIHPFWQYDHRSTERTEEGMGT